MIKWRLKTNSYKSYIWVILPILLVVIAGATAFQIVRKPSVSATAAVVCTGASASEFSCWQSRYNTIIAQQSPAPAFADFKKNYDTNPYVKSNCHQISHVIGRAAAKKYSTLAETYKHGDQFCWSGYYHGAIETVAQQIGPDKIISQITSVCADFEKSQEYSFNHYNCVHGMGHGLMAIQENQLFLALETCDNYKDTWEAKSCYSGVFMENVMNEINPGSHSDYLKKDDPLYPCTAVQDRYKPECYLMQTSHALLVVNYDYNKVFDLCSKVDAPLDVTCYQSLGRDVSGQSSSEQVRTIELCMQGPTATARENCFTGAVKDFISYFHSDKQGLALCTAITDAELSSSCTTTARDYYRSF
jgi:hypothetical protein